MLTFWSPADASPLPFWSGSYLKSLSSSFGSLLHTPFPHPLGSLPTMAPSLFYLSEGGVPLVLLGLRSPAPSHCSVNSGMHEWRNGPLAANQKFKGQLIGGLAFQRPNPGCNPGVWPPVTVTLNLVAVFVDLHTYSFSNAM